MEVSDGVVIDACENLEYKCQISFQGSAKATRSWSTKTKEFLCDHLGFEKSDSNPCLYVKCDDRGTFIAMAIFVDDVLVTANRQISIPWLKS